MEKKELVDCFYNTIQLSNSILSSRTKKSIKSNKVYKENFIAKKRKIRNELYFDIDATVFVELNSSFNVAKKYLNYGKTAVLNFANPHNPGGGVQNGAMAQEERLCRSSNLYLCISNQNVFNDYYLYNRNICNDFFSDRLIYTKNVTVFKDDSPIPKVMPENEWFNVDIITCAAPYIAKRNYTNLTALKLLFKSRIKNILEAAIDNDVDVIILGAFGCGAFKNPPELVAKAFNEVLNENEYCKYFKKIVFAIKSNNSNNSNYSVFCDELCALDKQAQMKIPPLPFIEPLRSKCYDLDTFFDYQNWKKNNKYYKKQFSIFGDSVSTLAGYNPKGCKVFYDSENCEKSGVKEMGDTWWGKVIDFFGGELLVNNSWSGSRVTRLPNSNTPFPSGCSEERTSSLHINNVNPDVIIIYLGFNDWANGVHIYSNETHVLEFFCEEYFIEAYEIMISKLKENYPKAEIWCCTLNTTYMSSNPSFSFPGKYRGIHIEEYNNQIKQLAKTYGCKLIDLYSYQVPYDSIDGSHPNKYGMNTLATLIVKEIGGANIYKFLDNENINKSESDFCPYCGKEINLDDAFCAYCGKPLKENFELNDSLKNNSEFNICPNCHQKTLKHTVNSDYCTNCNFEKLFYIDYRSLYIWDPSNMNIEDMNFFEISFGYYPIFYISYDGEKLTVCKRINPRDGGIKSFPDNFFDDKIVKLTNEQKNKIISFLKKIDFNLWKTEDYVIKNYEDKAVGFYVNDSFTITFKNGKCFKCYEPKVKDFTQLVNYLKGFCDKSWFEIFYNNNDEKNFIASSKEKYDADVDYILLPQNMTRCLHDNTLKLYDVDTNQNIEIKKNKIDVGRNFNCDLHIDSNYISQIHASFYYEDSSWFIMDKNSMNGTWLNGVKLDGNKKYELDSDYIINFAGIKKYIFYKLNVKDDSKQEEDKLVSTLEKSLHNLSNNDDSVTVLKLIALLLSKIPMYLPVEYDYSEMFSSVDPMKLKPGDIIANNKDVRIKILTLQSDCEEVVPIFTSLDEAHKGPSASFIRMYPQAYLPTVIAMNKSIALNVYNDNGISLKNQFFKDVVFPLVQYNLKEESNKANEIKVGTIINDKYELLKQIGQGGTTNVYLAIDNRVNKQWAIKILRDDLPNFELSKNSLLKEVEILKRLNHPAIPKIIDVIESNDFFAIVLDYIEGETLDSIVNNYGKQSVMQIIDWSLQLCDVLGYLHSLNPPHIYRDMKPANIILKPDGKISIIDFGIMRTYKPNQKADTVSLGTVGFAAPEQFGSAQTDCRSDIYALGMTMYNLCSGIRPKGNCKIDFINEKDALSNGLISIIKKCTELNPKDRYQSCNELKADLLRLKKNKHLKKRFKFFN